MSKLLTEFQQHSQDFLRLIGDKSRESERSKSAARELGILEYFYDLVDNLINKYESQLIELKLLSVTEHAKATMLRMEIKSMYNDLYKIRNKIPAELAAMMAKTILPIDKDLEQDIIIK